METCNLVGIPKIKNGSKLSFGKDYKIEICTDKHFNWFQKRMIQWCFGIDAEDYTEEG